MDTIDVENLTAFQEVQDEWRVITGFLDWLEESGIFLAESYGPERFKKAGSPIKDMLADYYEIDLIAVAEEKEKVVQHYLSSELITA